MGMWNREETNMNDATVEGIIAERGKVYGDPRDSHVNIGLSWTGLFQQHYGITLPHVVPPSLVAQMMVVFKMNRAARVFHEDNYVDAHAYVGFAQSFQAPPLPANIAEIVQPEVRGLLEEPASANLQPTSKKLKRTKESEEVGIKMKGKRGGGRGSGMVSQYCDDVVEWISRRPGTFRVMDLPLRLRMDLKSARMMLRNLVTRKKLRLSGEPGQRGVYLGGVSPIAGTGSQSPVANPPSPIQYVVSPSAPAVTVNPAGSSFMDKVKGSPQRAAVETIAIRLGPKSKWSATEMENWFRKGFPELISTPSKVSDLRVRLVDMANEGLLVREGRSPFCTYRLGPGLINRDVPVSAETKADLKISVPRDADAGKDGE